MNRSLINHLKASFLPEAVLLLLTLGVRLVRLGYFTIFWDEAFHIWNARLIPTGMWWTPIHYARWLNVYLVSLFRPTGEETLWLARAVSVLLSVATTAACIALGRSLDSRLTGRLAGLLYIVLPYAFIYDRQILSDPIMAAFGALALVSIIQVARRPRPVYSLLAGALLAGAILSKFSGALFLVMPAVATLVFAPSRSNWRTIMWCQALATAAAVAIVLFTLFRADQAIAAHGGGSVFETWRWCHSPQCGGKFELSRNLELTKTNLGMYAERIPAFWGYPFFIAVVATFAFNRSDRLRERLYLWAPAFGLVLPFVVTADLFSASYLTYTLAPMTVLAAMSTRRVIDWLAGRHIGTRKSKWLYRAALAVLIGGLTIPSAYVEYQFAVNYESAPWVAQERANRSITWSPWRAIVPAKNALLDLQKSTGRRINIIAVPDAHSNLTAWWGGRRGLLEEYAAVPGQRTLMATWLASGDDVFFIEQLPFSPLPADTADYFGVRLASAGDFEDPRGSTRIRLWRVAGTSPELSDEITRMVFVGDPGGLREFYPAFGDSLAGLPGQTPIVLYPPHQLPVLEDLIDPARAADLVPLGNPWPIYQEDLETQLDSLAQSHAQLTVLFWQETDGDPDRLIETWLNTHLYKIQEQWFGPLRRLDFASGAASGEPQEFSAQFGERIRLERGQLLDTDARPSGIIRVRLNWQATGPIEQSYKVFAHISNQEGALVAQHDGIPMGELAPSNTWVPGQTVIDQFAILLPPELPTGHYSVRIGLYDIVTQARLPVAGGGDSVVAGEFDIP